METAGEPAPVAFVVVKPRRGAPAQPPSSGNLSEWAADPQDVARVRAHFAGRGFKLGASAAGTFSIQGPPALFLACFGVHLEAGAAGTVRVAEASAPGASLPLERLPAEVRRLIHAAGFAEAPDFGPGSFA